MALSERTNDSRERERRRAARTRKRVRGRERGCADAMEVKKTTFYRVRAAVASIASVLKHGRDRGSGARTRKSGVGLSINHCLLGGGGVGGGGAQKLEKRGIEKCAFPRGRE